MKRLICILPAVKAHLANAWLASRYGADAVRTFTAGLNPSGRKDAPSTHYVCNWLLGDSDYAAIVAELSKPGYAARITEAPEEPGEHGRNAIVAAGLGGQ